MNKLLIISSAIMLSLGLSGCNTMNNAMNGTERFAHKTVGTGIKYTATAVGTGVGVVSKTGAAIGEGVGTVVNTGVGTVQRMSH